METLYAAIRREVARLEGLMGGGEAGKEGEAMENTRLEKILQALGRVPGSTGAEEKEKEGVELLIGSKEGV